MPAMRDDRGRLVWIMGGAACLLLFLATCRLFWSFTVDDSYISFHYLQNWLDGHGLVFNPGDRVEGYSNLLWIIVLAGPGVLGFDIVVTSKVLGVLAGMVTIVATLHLARRHIELDWSIGLTFAAILATHVGMVFYAVSGMETVFYTALVVILNGFLLAQRWKSAGWTCAALLLTRPDGVLFMGPFLLALFLKKGFRPLQWWPLLIPMAVLAGLHGWRWSFYGELLPNTFYAKVETPTTLVNLLVTRGKDVIRYLYASFTGNATLLVLAALSLTIGFKKKWLPLAASIACALSFVWVSRGDWMSFGRFLLPVTPLIILLAARGLDVLSEGIPIRHRRWALVPALVILLGVNALQTRYGKMDVDNERVLNPAMNARHHAQIGRWLEGELPPEGVVATDEIGAVAYFSRRTTIDLLGLTDRSLAQFVQKRDWRGYGDYLLSREPDILLLKNKISPWQEELDDLSARVIEELERHGGYRKDGEFALNYYKSWLVYRRTTSPSSSKN